MANISFALNPAWDQREPYSAMLSASSPDLSSPLWAPFAIRSNASSDVTPMLSIRESTPLIVSPKSIPNTSRMAIPFSVMSRILEASSSPVYCLTRAMDWATSLISSP